MCSVFWLFWLSYQYLPSARKLLAVARKTPLKKPKRGEGIISRKPMPKSAHDFLGLLYCFIVLLFICVVSCPYVKYYHTVMEWYSLFVLKVPLNPKQANKHIASWQCFSTSQVSIRSRVSNTSWGVQVTCSNRSRGLVLKFYGILLYSKQWCLILELHQTFNLVPFMCVLMVYTKNWKWIVESAWVMCC